MKRVLKVLVCYVLVAAMFLSLGHTVGADTINTEYTSDKQMYLYINEELEEQSAQFPIFLGFGLIMGLSFLGSLTIYTVLHDHKEDENQKK